MQKFRIAYYIPFLNTEKTVEPSFLQQRLISTGLLDRGHQLVYMSQAANLTDVYWTKDIATVEFAPRTWSKSILFRVARKVTWQIQKLLKIPYLNFFSNLCLMDAALQCLPGSDVVHERNGLYRMGVAMACRQLKIPYVFFFDADDVLEHDLFGKPLRGILRWVAKQALQYNLQTARKVICVSQSAKLHLQSVWNVPEAKIVVMPNAVDTERFNPDAQKREIERSRLHLDSKTVLIFVGSFYPYQDLDVLLDTFTELVKSRNDLILLLVGKGELLNHTQEKARSLNLGDAVRFIGPVPHEAIPGLLAAADIAVAPYRKVESKNFLGSSMKLIEYMACGLATVVSNIGQIGEIIHNGINGVLVPPGDTDMLTMALQNLIDGPEYRAKLGRQAIIDIREHYSWDHYICSLESVYGAAVSG